MAKDAYTLIIKEFCDLMKDIPSRTLAKIILRAHPDLGSVESDKDIDNIRTRVRVRRDLIGGNGAKEPSEYTGCNFIPIPMHHKKTFYTLKESGKILLVGDIHVPYQEPEAIGMMLDYAASKHKISAVIYCGDTLDCPTVSKFTSITEAPTMEEVVAHGLDVLDTFQGVFPKAKHVWKDGNHELRLPRYMRRNAPELANIIKHGAGDILEVGKRGMDYVGPLQLMKVGKLVVMHGHEVGINSVGVNPARSLYLKTQDTAMCFHLHNTSSHTDKTVRGKFPTCWSVGCLCDLNPDFRPYGNRYNWGFAVVDLHKNGDFDVENMRIFDGKINRG